MAEATMVLSEKDIAIGLTSVIGFPVVGYWICQLPTC